MQKGSGKNDKYISYFTRKPISEHVNLILINSPHKTEQLKKKKSQQEPVAAHLAISYASSQQELVWERDYKNTVLKKRPRGNTQMTCSMY